MANVDADTTEVCLQADGTVLPADDPWWDSHTPPLHFNCRSTVVTLSPEEAEEYGVTESPTELPAQEGFGHKAQEEEQAALDKWEEGKLSSVGPVLFKSYKGKKEVWEQAEAKRKEEQGQQSEPAEPTTGTEERPDAGSPPSELTEPQAKPPKKEQQSAPDLMPSGREPEQSPRWAHDRVPVIRPPWRMDNQGKPGTVDEGEGRRFRYEHERLTARYLASQGNDISAREFSRNMGQKNPDAEIGGVPVEFTSFVGLRKSGRAPTHNTVKSSITSKGAKPQAEYLVIDARGTSLTRIIHTPSPSAKVLAPDTNSPEI